MGCGKKPEEAWAAPGPPWRAQGRQGGQAGGTGKGGTKWRPAALGASPTSARPAAHLRRPQPPGLPAPQLGPGPLCGDLLRARCGFSHLSPWSLQGAIPSPPRLPIANPKRKSAPPRSHVCCRGGSLRLPIGRLRPPPRPALPSGSTECRGSLRLAGNKIRCVRPNSL